MNFIPLTKPVTLKVRVTTDDILKGEPEVGAWNPLALAMRRRMGLGPDAPVHVGPTEAIVNRSRWKLSTAAKFFMAELDNASNLPPELRPDFVQGGDMELEFVDG